MPGCQWSCSESRFQPLLGVAGGAEPGIALRKVCGERGVTATGSENKEVAAGRELPQEGSDKAEHAGSRGLALMKSPPARFSCSALGKTGGDTYCQELVTSEQKNTRAAIYWGRPSLAQSEPA